jgi:hypothetical protein
LFSSPLLLWQLFLLMAALSPLPMMAAFAGFKRSDLLALVGASLMVAVT